MLYEDEFKVTRTHGYTEYRKYISTGNILCAAFTVWTGHGLAYDDNGYLIDSVPRNPGLVICDYEQIVLELSTSKRVIPSQIDTCLEQYDKLFNKTNIGVMDIISFEHLYAQICNKYNCPTKAEAPSQYFCDNCGIPLLYKSLTCWACEKGI